VPGSLAQGALEALRDLAGRFVGEGERADALGGEAQVLQEETDPFDQAERLPGARSGEHQQRRSRRLDRCAL
jgi:hypothetical protein